MTCDAIGIYFHYGFQKLQTFFVNVNFDHFRRQILSDLKILNGYFSSFFENNKTVNVPSIEPESTASVVH